MSKRAPGFEVIQEAVRLACRAPSLHNSQPWRWVVKGPTLHLYADLTQMMNSADPEGREIYLSCGAALDHLVVAMADVGWYTAVRRFPDAHDPLHIATMDFRRAAMGMTERTHARAAAISKRRTDRRPFGAPIDWSDFESYLRQTVHPYQVMFDVVPDDARPTLAFASRLTETMRANDPSYAAELSWWTSPLPYGKGVPPSALPSSAMSGRVDIARGFGTPNDAPPAEGGSIDESKIVVLSTHREDNRLDVVRCGEALSAVLLECTAAGLATCTLTHLTELAQSRAVVRGLTRDSGTPQLLVRVGRAVTDESLAATPRMPIAEALEWRF
jgi:nitroreductase